jgi:Caspase domain
MKKFILLLLSFGSAHLIQAQGFTGRTNEAHVDFTKAPVSSPLPEIYWITPKLESSFSDQYNLSIDATVKSDIALKSVMLKVLRSGDTLKRDFPVQAGEFTKLINQSLKLLDGENILELLVENEKGGIVSSRRSVLVGRDNAALLSASRKDYALIFATDRYDHWGNLVNPINDARTIEAILKEKYNFQTEVVENATLEEVLGKLTDYNAKKFNLQDQLFIFFAGHGSFDETLGEGYVVASNSLRNDKGRTTYLPHTVLRQRVDNIKCEHIFLAMDVCFGGTIDPVLASARGVDEYAEASDTDYLVRKLSKRTRKFLTSGSKEYVSDGVAGKHSPFAAKFVQALREVGAGNDRILTLPELQTYFLKLPTEPRMGGFGSDDKASDFVFVAK